MDLFDLAAKIMLDTGDYEKKLAGAEKQGSGFADKLKNGLLKAAKAVGAGIGSAITAVSAFIGNSVKEYANYEQLVGGVETLFKKSASIVEEYAANAYKTAGLSANEYMETVTSFSASLLQSLGGDTEKAANYANMAIVDMSDNANKMGTSIESIQMAYQGFAKQNYTMLDNLKLGYGGTKTEMERLIADAEKLNTSFHASRDENGKLTVSYADVVDAIHIVQTQMGITGTTAKEASTTIQGSVSAMKAAWSNLMVGIADDNADFERLVSDMASTASTVFENIIPRLKQSLKGVAQLVRDLGPIIANELPGIVNDVLPELSKVAVDLILTLVNSIVENLPMLVETAFQIVGQLVTSIGQALPELIPAAVSMVIQIVESLLDNIDLLIDAAIELIMGLAEGLIKAVPILIEKAPEIIMKLVEAIIRNAPKLIKAGLELVVKLIAGIVQSFGKLFGAGEDVVNKIGEGIKNVWDNFKEWAGNIVSKIGEGIKNAWDKIKEFGSSIVNTIGDGIKSVWDNFKGWAGDIINRIKTGLEEGFQRIKDVGKNLVEGLWGGIKEKAKWLKDKVSGWASDLWGSVKKFFGVHSPSTKMAWIGEMLDKGLASGIDKYGNRAIDAARSVSDGILASMSGLSGSASFDANYASANVRRAFGGSSISALSGSGVINLYLDGDTLVGSTDKRMDRNLGQIQKLKSRYGGV